MYEHQTFEAIMDRMLGRVSGQVDKREGSIIYDALAPAAFELAQLYADLDMNTNLSFADSASDEFLERRTSEFGIHRHPATKARRKGLFSSSDGAAVDVPLGSRYSIQNTTFAVVERLESGQFVLECESSGVEGNIQFGPLLPIEYINGLARAELADVLVPGEDAEDDESLRQRYYEAVNEPAFGGNIADYKKKINGISGVGGVKVFPVWQGGGTVKCTIITSDFSPPTKQMIDGVQTVIDPVANQGKGLGHAPIGHAVTIAGVVGTPINVETTVTLQSGMVIGQVQDDIKNALSEYLLSLRRVWKDENRVVVRVAQIEARVLNVPGIVDITNTKLNGSAANVELGEEQIPMLGTVKVNG